MTGGSVPWVLLELRLLADGSVAATYRDSRGRRLAGHGSQDGEPRHVNVGEHLWPLWVPRDPSSGSAPPPRPSPSRRASPACKRSRGRRNGRVGAGSADSTPPVRARGGLREPAPWADQPTRHSVYQLRRSCSLE